jgi:hypothetical protein
MTLKYAIQKALIKAFFMFMLTALALMWFDMHSAVQYLK